MLECAQLPARRIGFKRVITNDFARNGHLSCSQIFGPLTGSTKQAYCAVNFVVHWIFLSSLRLGGMPSTD